MKAVNAGRMVSALVVLMQVVLPALGSPVAVTLPNTVVSLGCFLFIEHKAALIVGMVRS